MAKGLSLDIGMNTREVLKGSGDIETALEGVSDTLDDLARAGDQDAEKLERSFSDAMRDITTETKRAGDSVARNMQQGTTRATDSLRELKTEGLQNVAETLSSTDGSLQSFADGVQGTMGGVVAGLSAINPAAAAVAGGAALSFALVTAELTRQEEAAKKLRERFNTLYQEASEEGRAFLTEAQIQAEVLDILWNTERVDEYKQAQADAKSTGLDLSTVLRAQAGDQKALNDVLAVAGAQYDEVSKKAAETRANIEGAVQGGNVGAGIEAQTSGAQQLLNRYQAIADTQDEYSDKAEEASAIVAAMQQAERDQIKRTSQADEDRWTALAEHVAEAAAKPPVVIDTDLKVPDANALVKKLQRDLDSKKLGLTVQLKTGLGQVVL